jgi:hypothetical protein
MDILTHLLVVTLIGGLGLNATAGLIKALFRRDPLTWIVVVVLLLWSGHFLLAFIGISMIFEPFAFIHLMAEKFDISPFKIFFAGVGAYFTRSSLRVFEESFLRLLSPGRW